MPLGTQAKQIPEDLASLGVEPRFIPLVTSAISQDQQSSDGEPPLNRAEVETLVEILHKVVSSPAANPTLKVRCSTALRRVSSTYGVLPRSYLLPDVTITDDIPYDSGRSMKVWKGYQNGNPVCIKAVRGDAVVNLDEVKRRFYHEAIGWMYASHPNLLPFLGVSETSSFPFSIISPWLPNGNILNYTRKNWGADRFQLLAQAASGLEHLHLQGIVHGNVHPGNILITEDHNACLGDFGIARTISTLAAVDSQTMTTSKPGVVRYMAPELLIGGPGPKESNLLKSDIYSLAITAFEILSEVLPYGTLREVRIAFNIVSGRRPYRPNNPAADRWLPDPIWDALQHCWDLNPDSRWPIQSLHRVFTEQKGDTPAPENDKVKIHINNQTTSSSGSMESLPLPQTPTNCFAREETITRLLSHADKSMSTVLSGAVGIGKTTIALATLHHDRTQAKFGPSRHFMRCDDLINSLESFLERLSSSIKLSPTRTMDELRPHLMSLPPLMLALDGVERILDPLAKESREICTAIEEISQYEGVCLLATSRMRVDIQGFHTVEVVNLPEDGAQDIFYSLCHLTRSPTIDNLLASLDFHPLSIDLLSRAAFENYWDESKLVQEWNNNQTSIMKVDDQSLEATIESALAPPTIANLGLAAYATLGAIAAFPSRVEETRVRRIFPAIREVAEVIDVLCKFYLLERHDGLVKMSSPLRFYFLKCTPLMVHIRKDGENHGHIVVREEEYVRCNEAIGVPPVFTAGPKREEKNHSSLIIKHRRSVRGGAGGTVEPESIAGRIAGCSNELQNNPVNSRDASQTSGRKRTARRYLGIICIGMGKSFDLDLPVGQPSIPEVVVSSQEPVPTPYQL